MHPTGKGDSGGSDDNNKAHIVMICVDLEVR
jgi:hypothetical protein